MTQSGPALRLVPSGCLILLLGSAVAGQTWQILENTREQFTLSIQHPTLDIGSELEQLSFPIGLPMSSAPQIIIGQLETLPFEPSPDHPYHFEPPDQPVEWSSVERYRDLNVGILKFSPLVRRGDHLERVTSIRLTLLFPEVREQVVRIGSVEQALYQNRVLNWKVAKRWVSRPLPLRKKLKVTLPQGGWYRLPIEEDGLYKLTRDALAAAGLDVNNIDPRSLGLFTNPQGGRPMSSIVGAEIPENLIEVAILVTGQEDGTLDEEDKIVFYGRGPRGFDGRGSSDVAFTQNPYTDRNYYWLNVPSEPGVVGKRIETKDESYVSPVPLDYGLGYLHQESDLENPYNSGTDWVGTGFTRNQTVTVAFNLHHPKEQIDVAVKMALLGTTTSETEKFPTHHLIVTQSTKNGPEILNTTWSSPASRTFTTNLVDSVVVEGANLLVFRNVSTDPSRIHIDWNTLKYGRELIWEDSPIEFWAPPNVSIARFIIASVSSSDVTVWDITEFAEPVQHILHLSGGNGQFEVALPDDELARFIAFRSEVVPEVQAIVFEENQAFSTLRTQMSPIDHIIIAPDEFLLPAEELRQHRASHGLSSVVAPLKTIYDEFSGGTEDPLAIRYFLKWTKANWRNLGDGSFASYVLLLGDGDYDYRNITGNSHIMVPTLQSEGLGGFSSDDRFAYLDSESPDMAIGRFTAATLSDARNMVDKTIAYESQPEIGLWRRRVTLIADDFARPNFEDIELSHTENSEQVSKMIPRSLEVHKIYMEVFPRVTDGSQYGVARPEATEALFEILEKGTVILSYIGHGSLHKWAQETLFSSTRGDLALVNTGMKLPIWVAATCSWGSYDNVEGSAASEELLRLPENGAVAIISTKTKISFEENKTFILNLFRSFFPNHEVTDQRLGAVFQAIKNGSQGSELFHLFGDPALRIALASDTVSVQEVSPDTLVALERGSFAGQVDQVAPSEGDGYVIVYDADRNLTLTSPYGRDVSYAQPGQTLFRGLLSFQEGTFQGNFIVPKDINYRTSDARLAVYLYANQGNGLWEGLGVKGNLVLSGTDTIPDDVHGPLISFHRQYEVGNELKELILQWGDHIAEDGELIIRMSDPRGINVTGQVGHNIRLWLDEDESNAVDITDDFVYDPGSYTSGSVAISAEDFPSSEALITVEAWDNANNPAQKSIALHLTSTSELMLTNIFNYPNPFSNWTQFGFEVNREATVTIKVFTLAGQHVVTLGPEEAYPPYDHIDWNGKDDFNDEIANGAYLYQVTAVPVEGGKKVTHVGKIAKYR